MSNELHIAFNEIAHMRELPSEVVLEALESALVSAYRKDSGASAAQEISAQIDPDTGRTKVYVEKEVVDDVYSDSTEVTLETARFYQPEAELHDVVMVQVEHTTRSFGRIAAQTAKQVISQKIREAERNALYDEFIEREGDLITGTVQSVNSRQVTLSLGRAEADLIRPQQIPGERYRTHERIRVYIMEVKRSSRGPQILVSRGHRNMLRRLLEYEVPEIYNGQVEIKNIAREAGFRSKVAVAALQDGIDPVGACVGMRGIRIQNIVKELHNEKIDVIEWSADPVAFITRALSPARVTGVYLDDDPRLGKTAVVIAPDDQLSLAIGREGQNARLAAKLTGWRIDIKSVVETVQAALDNLASPPLEGLPAKHGDLIAEAERILEKKRAELAVMPEEYKALGRFAEIVEHIWQEEREKQREIYLREKAAVRETLVPELFELPLDVLAISQEMLDILEPYENVGEIMLASLVDDDLVTEKLSALEDEPMTELQAAFDTVLNADIEALLQEAISIEDDEEEDIPEAAEQETASAEGEASAEARDESSADETAEEPEVLLDAFGQPLPQDKAAPTDEAADTDDKAIDAAAIVEPVVVEDQPAAQPAREFEVEEDEVGFELDRSKGKLQRRKDRQKRRQLVLDEKSGEVIAKRRRKGRRGSWDDETWEDYDY